MAVVYDKIVGTASDTSGSVQTLAITVAAGGVSIGDAIVVQAGWADSSRSLTSVTDTRGNTYRVDVSAGPRVTTNDWVGIGVCYVSTALLAADTIVLHWSGAGGVGPNIACRADAFSGWSSIPVIDGSPHTNAQAASAAPTTGGLATTNANDLLIALFTSTGEGTGVVTGDAAFTTMGSNNSGAAGESVTGQYKIVSSSGTYTATGSATAANWQNAIVGYQLPGASASFSLPTPFGAREPRFFSPGVRTRADAVIAEVNAQQARPSADNIVTTWTRGGRDTGTLYGQVDEPAPGDDADYITSSSS